VLADNKLALNSGWDHELLAIELQALIDIDFDVELTGFSPAEIDLVLEDAREGSPNTATEAEDQIPFPIEDQTSAVTRADLRGRARPSRVRPPDGGPTGGPPVGWK
jgi:hypothetical protein